MRLVDHGLVVGPIDAAVAALPLLALPLFAVYAAGHAFTRFYKPRLEALDLTYPQYLVLIVLWERDDITVNALGNRLFLDSGTITPLIKRLEARGLAVTFGDDYERWRASTPVLPFVDLVESADAVLLDGCKVK